jgi:hypothetical protein
MENYQLKNQPLKKRHSMFQFLKPEHDKHEPAKTPLKKSLLQKIFGKK